MGSLLLIFRRKNVGGFFVVISRPIKFLTSSFTKERKKSFWSAFWEKGEFRFINFKKRLQGKRRNW